MEYLPNDRLLKFNKTTLEDVRKEYNLHKPGDMEAAVNILEEWVKQQKHFAKKNFSKRYLENTIILSKGSLEIAKSRVDKSCTIKTLMPEFFANYNVRQDCHGDLKNVTNGLLPKMTKDHCRVCITKVTGNKFSSTITTSYIQQLILFIEYIRAHDYALKYYAIIDYSDADILQLASAIQLTELQKLVTITIGVHGFRPKGIYVITQSKFAYSVVNLFKQILSEKISKRLHVHKNWETIAEIVGKDILPCDFGGEEKCLAKIYEDWLEVLSTKEQVEYQREMNAARTDESLRHRDTFNQQYMGMPGTFRTLSVD